MKTFTNTTKFHIEGPCAVTLGKFDGIHRGHMRLMNRILEWKKAHPEGSSTVFSLNVRDEKLIMTLEEQKDFLEALGVDCLVQCPFVPEIYMMSPEQFVERILVRSLGAASVFVGEDFRFGHDRLGDAAFLQEAGGRYGFEAYIEPDEMYEGKKISSTFVREALEQGDVALARNLLGRPYSLSGLVVHGEHLGSRLGMPTANLIPAGGKLLPRRGVYVSRTSLDGAVYPSITNVGTKPTVDGTYMGAETFIYDVERELYGETITVELLQFFREEKKFAGIDALKAQIRMDIARGEAYFNEQSVVLS